MKIKKMLDLGTSFFTSVEKSPKTIAIAEIDNEINYEEWFKGVDKLCGGLKSVGLTSKDRVITLLQNNIEAATMHWACQIAGLTIVPLNWRMKSQEIDFCILDSDAKCIIYQEESNNSVKNSVTSQNLIKIFVGKQKKDKINFNDLLKNGNPRNSPEAKSDFLSLILYTSGTTGKPKGVPRTHFTERSSAIAHIAQNMYQKNESTLGVMPLYHTMGVRSLISMVLLNGTFIAQPKFSSQQAIELIEYFKITSLYLVPTLYYDLLENQYFSKEKVRTCKKLGFAGSPMNDGLIKKVMEGFEPKNLVNHYGSSEIYTFTVDQNANLKPGSAGKAGINQQIRVVKMGAYNTKKLLEKKVEGEIIANLNSDEAFSGYLKRPDANKKSIIDGWYFTGDLGYFDEEGDLFVTGRVDDMIITGGENVSPIEIENILSLNENILEVTVVGLPDPKWGQKVCAFVVRNKNLNSQLLDEYCIKSNMLNFKRPKEYIFVKEIPKSPTGKILRRKLVAGEYELD